MKRDTPPRKGESRIDLTLSWHMFWQNVKPFLTGQAIPVYVSLILSAFLWTAAPNYISPFEFYRAILTILIVLLVLFELAEFIMLLAFQGSVYAFTFNIMSSGDQFAEIHGMSRHFRKYFVRFLLVGIFLNIPVIYFLNIWILHTPFLIEHVVELSIVFSLLLFAFFVIFGQSGPVLIGNKSVKEAFKESFHTFLKAPRRIIKTWALYWVIFYLPQFITSTLVMTRISLSLLEDTASIPLLAVALGTEVWYYLIGIPIQALIATRIYNSLHLPQPYQ